MYKWYDIFEYVQMGFIMLVYAISKFMFFTKNLKSGKLMFLTELLYKKLSFRVWF